MRGLTIIILVAIAAIYDCPVCSAQAGWQWGITSETSFNPGIDAIAATVDAAGNVILAGYTEPALTGGMANYMVYGLDTVYNVPRFNQLITVKSDSDGHFLWARGTENANAWCHNLVTDDSGNIYAFDSYSDSICTFDGFTLHSTGHSTYCLVKYSSAGTVLWAKNVVSDSVILSEGAAGIDGAGNVYISGAFDHTSVTIGTITLTNTSPIPDTLDVFVAKYDADGNGIWARSFGGNYDDIPQMMTVSDAGNVYLMGYFSSASMNVGGTVITNPVAPSDNPFFVKYDSSGNVVWAKTEDHRLYANTITHDALENIYLAGSFNSTLVLGPDTITNAGLTNAFVAKLDSAAHFVWARCAGGDHIDQGYSVTLDECSNVWLSGSSSGQINWMGGYVMHFGADSLTLPTDDWDPVFIAKYSNTGVYDTSFAVKSGGDDVVFFMAGVPGTFYLAGDYFQIPVVFGPDSLAAPGSYEELYIAKYKAGSCNPEAGTLYNHTTTAPGLSITLYPNPATEECIVSCNGTFPANSVAELYDMTGRLMSSQQLAGNSTPIPVAPLSQGMYLCRIKANGQQLFIQKLVVMR